jgi:hypothetical protein
MTEVRYRLSWQLSVAILLVMIVAIVPIVVYFLDPMSLMDLAISMFIGWSVLILIALMGAFFLGLGVGHRAASKSDFSPFEVEMLKMNEEVKALKELVHRHNMHHSEGQDGKPPKPAVEKADNGGQARPAERPPEKPVLVEEEPEPRSPTDAGPEMTPVGKVRCSQCKTVIPLYSKKRPIEIKCTNCGKVGVLR